MNESYLKRVLEDENPLLVFQVAMDVVARPRNVSLDGDIIVRVFDVVIVLGLERSEQLSRKHVAVSELSIMSQIHK